MISLDLPCPVAEIGKPWVPKISLIFIDGHYLLSTNSLYLMPAVRIGQHPNLFNGNC